MADRINAKLGYRPIAEETKDTSLVDEADSLRRFEEELEINDFPQTARWKVTSRVSVVDVVRCWCGSLLVWFFWGCCRCVVVVAMFLLMRYCYLC